MEINRYTVKAERADGSVITVATYGNIFAALTREESVAGTFTYRAVWITVNREHGKKESA